MSPFSDAEIDFTEEESERLENHMDIMSAMITSFKTSLPEYFKTDCRDYLIEEVSSELFSHFYKKHKGKKISVAEWLMILSTLLENSVDATLETINDEPTPYH